MKLKRFDTYNESLRDKMEPKSEEEISSSLKKLHDDFVFDTKISDYYIEYHGLKGVEDIEYIELNNCTIYWNYELNTASWGINYIMPRINKISVTAEVFIFNEEKELDESFEKEFLYDIMNSDIDTESEDNDQKLPFAPNQISFSHLEISEDNKPQILITF